MSRNAHRLATALVLSLVLASPAAQAAGPGSLSPAGTHDVLREVWGWLASLWSAPEEQGDAGCNIDPNGVPRCTPVTAQVDAGCNIDPDGKPRCAP